MGKQNLAMFERAMRLFSPFGGAGGGAVENAKMEAEEAAPMPSPPPTPAPRYTAANTVAPPPPPSASPVSMSAPMGSVMPRNVTPMMSPEEPAPDQDVQRKIAALQRQLADLAKSKG
jgi:hypothetical protein